MASVFQYWNITIFALKNTVFIIILFTNNAIIIIYTVKILQIIDILIKIPEKGEQRQKLLMRIIRKNRSENM